MAAKRKQRSRTSGQSGRGDGRRGPRGDQAARSKRTAREQAGAESSELRVGQRLERVTGALGGAGVGPRESVEGKVGEAKDVFLKGAGRASRVARHAGESARKAGESARKAGRSALGAARRHPVPTALTGVGAACAGIGAAWLLFGQRRGAATNGSSGPNVAKPGGEEGSRVEDVESTAQRVVHRITDETHELAERAQASIGPAAHRVKDMARDAFAETQLLGDMAKKRFKQHPLFYGAAMVAVATAIGAAALPRAS
jgi:hypothetical protein